MISALALIVFVFILMFYFSMHVSLPFFLTVHPSPDMALGFYRAAQIEFIAPPPYCWQITGRRF